jgi:hypothetical protein
MRIPPSDNLPAVAQRAEWARLLNCAASSLYRAEKQGLLSPARTKGGRILYTKDSILEWLGLEEMVAPVLPMPPAVQFRPLTKGRS